MDPDQDGPQPNNPGNPDIGDIFTEPGVAKAKILRRRTKALRFISAIQEKDENELERFLSNHRFSSDKERSKLTARALKLAVESDKEELVLSLKSQIPEIPGFLLLDALSSDDQVLATKLIKLQIFSVEYLYAYFWFLVYKENYSLANELASLTEELQRYSGLLNLKPLLTDSTLSELALEQAFKAKCDSLAKVIIKLNPSLVRVKFIDDALQNDCISYLREVSRISSMDVKKTYSKSIDSNLELDNEGKSTAGKLGVQAFLDYYISRSKFDLVRQIVLWPEAEDFSDTLQVLILHDLENIAIEYVENFERRSSSKEFDLAFDAGMLNLCLSMLDKGVTNLDLGSFELQKKIVDSINEGELCLACVEILGSIPSELWNSELTKTLLVNLSNFAKRTDNIIYCPKPILYCVKVMELLSDLSEQNYEYKAKCLAVTDQYQKLALELQEQIKGEEDLKYFMMHQDSGGDNALFLIAKNQFNEMLQNEDVGTIIEKLWSGAKNARSIFEASTIYMSLNSGISNPDSKMFMKRMNKNRNYSFQYEQWLDSCSFRFFAQGISTGILVVIYQILIYRTFELTSLFSIDVHDETKGYFLFVQAWIFGLIMEQILHVLYVSKKQKPSLINEWRALDVFAFILMILVSRDISGNYVQKNFTSDPTDDTPASILLSLLMIVIWLRFTGIVVVTKTYGQFLRIIYYMIGETLNFFIILIALFVCAAGVFTACFNNSNPNFVTFDISLRTVFADAMGGFDLTAYTSHVALGGSFEAFYLMLSNVVLLNLLVAIITNVYETLVEWVDSEHRNVIILYTEKYKWDDKYGFLIYLPSPLSSLVILISPFVLLLSKNPEKWNNIICRVFYVIYASGIFIWFNLIGIFNSIPLYIKGFGIYAMRPVSRADQNQVNETVQINNTSFVRPSFSLIIFRSFIWVVIGFPVILWALFRDAYDFLSILYKKIEGDEDNIESVKFDTFLDKNFIINLHKALDYISKEEVTIPELIFAWKLFDESSLITFEEEQNNTRDEEAEEFFKQFLTNLKVPVINIEFIRKMVPKVKGENYDEDYINRVRYLNIYGLSKGIRNFHANIGALNISGITIPKPEPDENFDMERVNVLNNSIKELDELYLRLLKYSSRLVRNYEEIAK